MVKVSISTDTIDLGTQDALYPIVDSQPATAEALSQSSASESDDEDGEAR